MKFLLDSNIVIAAALGTGDNVLRGRMAACDDGDLVMSAIVYAEVLHGSVRDKPPSIDRLRAFVEEVPVLEFDRAAATAYASLGFRRASYDQLIAAHALALDVTLVTDNERDFVEIPKLQVENWVR
ncbi:type II toxin-antitoxin system VapC family toxin [uncultured Sphingomonas sp.]|uniref:type II toxin-antitoxin system VapC family toxin n=1 Tax=uncultured Sphingomonas sp. TaxID=158754 RepID=UPI0035C9BB3C